MQTFYFCTFVKMALRKGINGGTFFSRPEK